MTADRRDEVRRDTDRLLRADTSLIWRFPKKAKPLRANLV